MLYWILGIILTVFALYLLFSFFIFKLFTDRSFSKDMFFKGKKAKEGTASDASLNLDYEEVFINSVDNIQLHSYVLKNLASSNWIICVHGYSGNATNLLPQIKHFYDNGYNVLAVDLRAHGKSQGRYCGLSYLDAKDIKLWIDWILKFMPNAFISLFGVSLGGASVLMTASTQTDKNIKCVISDSAPTDFLRQFEHIWSWFIKIPPKIILPAVNMWMKLFAKYSLEDTSLINNIEKMRIPSLIIHGEQDHFVRVQMAYELFENISTSKELLIVPNADHTQSIDVSPDLYWKQIDAFLDKYMNANNRLST